MKGVFLARNWMISLRTSLDSLVQIHFIYKPGILMMMIIIII